MRHGLGLAQAFRTLTIIPVPGPDAENPSRQLHFYPFVGFFLGCAGSAIVYLCSRCMDFTFGLCIVLGVLWACYMAFMTRAFHLDGLGDTADGFGGGWTRERRLEIMKDSRSGSFGVVAISLCLLLKAASSAAIIAENSFILLLWATFIARVQVVFMCSLCRYAKESGLSYELVSKAKAGHFISALLQLVAVALGLHYLLEVKLAALLVPFVASTMTMSVLALVSKRKIDGITGDVLGACCEMCEVIGLASCVFLK